ncbi:hypothetical protein BHM03_00052179 [Ensete ventricosum]|nr:hypothetical protein BHM03_00052179 [Ensete ventricosum]
MMHPLRFPNNGIRAKVFMRKVGFKQRVMRLNYVELFYALVAAIGSESRHCLRGRGGHMHAVCMQRWLATARPPIGAVGHGLATCKGRPPARAAARKGASRQGLPPASSPAASRGGGAGCRGGRPMAGWLPAAKGSHRLRRGSGGDGVVRVKEG